MFSWLCRALLLVASCLVLVAVCSGAAVPAQAMESQDLEQDGETPRRVQRSFGGDDLGYFGAPRAAGNLQNMVNWKANLGKRAEMEKADEMPRRTQRSFGGNDLGYFGAPRGVGNHQNMVNWKANLGKRAEMDKRQMEFYPANRFGSGLDRGQFQDWSSTFGRNYRSFGDGYGSTLGSSRGRGFGAGRENLQSWRSFFGRPSSR